MAKIAKKVTKEIAPKTIASVEAPSQKRFFSYDNALLTVLLLFFCATAPADKLENPDDAAFAQNALAETKSKTPELFNSIVGNLVKEGWLDEDGQLTPSGKHQATVRLGSTLFDKKINAGALSKTFNLTTNLAVGATFLSAGLDALSKRESFQPNESFLFGKEEKGGGMMDLFVQMFKLWDEWDMPNGGRVSDYIVATLGLKLVDIEEDVVTEA